MARNAPTDSATVARFLSHTERAGDCLLWTASLQRGGYGQFKAGKNGNKNIVILAHRYAWIVANGEIPHGMLVCHTCDRRPCVEPDHLFIGTYTDNNRDMFKKGRGHIFDGTHILGTKNHLAKLSETDVRLIRRLHAEGTSANQLAIRFGICGSTVGDIVHGLTWKHILTPEEALAARYAAGEPQQAEMKA